MNSELSPVTPLPFSIKAGNNDSLGINWHPSVQRLLADTIYFFINSSTVPVKISLSGSSIPTPSIDVNLTQIDMGTINVNTSSRDTSFYVYNRGTAFDSVLVAFNLGNIITHNAVSVAPLPGFWLQ